MNVDKSVGHVLVVEDNPGDFALVDDFLLEKFPAIRVSQAETFAEARKRLKAGGKNFDLVLLDLSLPDKTGEQLIEEITALCGSIPVIVLTGYSDFSFGVKSLSLGVEDYILKDELTPMILYKSILYAVERKKSVRALEEFVTERLNYIHEIELQNERLQEISWIQSHMVRAPLARLLGLISLIRGAKDNSGELQYMMNYIEESANELDQVVKEITMRTIVPESDPLLKQAI